MVAQPKHINYQIINTQSSLQYIGIQKAIKLLFLICSFLIVSFCTTISFAQYTYELDKTTRFEEMGAKEGLSTGYAYSIHQDKYGFIWIGTQNGLNLYDGYEVKVFNADPKNPQALFNDYIFSIYEEPDGTMWFTTSIGLSRYNRATQTFTNHLPDTLDLNNDNNGIRRIVDDGESFWVDIQINDFFRFNKKTGQFQSFAKDTLNPSNGIQGSNTSYVFVDGTGVLWVASSEPEGDYVFNRFDKETETFTHFINDPADPESFPGKQVKSMTEDNNGIIWIATLGGGLLEIVDKEKGRFRQYVHNKNDQNSIIHNYLQKVFTDSLGNVWVGGTKGFSKINKKTGSFTNYHIPNRIDFPNRSNVIYDINEGVNGELFLSSRGGLFRFNPSANKLSHYLYDPENPGGISDNLVYQVITDHTDQTWIVVPNSCIHRINQFSNAFIRIQKRPNINQSLSDNFTYSFLTDSRGNFWIGTFGGGLNRTNSNNNRGSDNFEHFIFKNNDPNSISGKRITTIYEDRNQILWFGTFWGLNSYDYNTNSFTRYQYELDDSTTLSDNMVEAIFEDSRGTFWVGTRNGLNIMDRETGKFIQLLPDDNDSSSIIGSDIKVIFEDSFSELWFAGSSVEKLNRKDTSFVQIFPNICGKSDTCLSSIVGIAEDDSANLWFSTYRDGIYKFNRLDSTFTIITTQQGLPSNSINGIEIDDRGFIWASTTQGLSKLDPFDYSIRNFDMADGLVSLEFINKSSYKDDEGWLYFGSRDGFNVFHPDSIKENKVIPPVYITSLSVAGESKYFEKPLYEMSSIELQYSENDFSFDFVALNYINSEKNQYAFILEGYDDDWIYADNRRTAYYTNLSSGKYTFRVKGSNNDGYWNEEGASLVVVILPPIWKTWWAYVIYVLVFFGLVYLLRRNELRKITLRQELELEQVNAEKLAELDIEKNKFFSNISHEFRTPLTLILGPLERLISQKKNNDEKEQLNLVKRNARRLQTLINQLLSLSKLESGKMKLKARPENIVKLTRLFLQSFHSMAEDRDIKLEFISDAEEYIIFVDTIKFEKVVNNLLSNAFKFTENGGEIKVNITPLPPLRGDKLESPITNPVEGESHALSPLEGGQRGVTIKFSDTGLGIKKEDLPHVFDRFYQVDEAQMKTNLGTGIGLSLTKELVELHHGTITIESESGVGSTFKISLPEGKEHLLENEILESGNGTSEMDEELLNDDYLFVQDVTIKTDLKEEISTAKNLPLLLIVEDNDDMRVYIKSYLDDSYNIIEAENGKEGAEKAIEHIPDLIVSDLMMPKLDGNEMTNQLKSDERTSHIPIILLTAKASKESKLEGLETGADDFLTKPFDADELLVRVSNLINQRKRLREIFGKKLSYSISPSATELKDSGITSMDEQFLKKAFETAQQEMSDPEFGVVPLSKQMGLSRMQLHRKLTALTDQSATEFIKTIRLNKAAYLLKSKSATAAEIGYDVGFNSPTYFSTCFKEHFGKTPLEYTK